MLNISGVLPVPSKQQGFKIFLYSREISHSAFADIFIVFLFALRTLFGTGYQWIEGIMDPGCEKKL